MDPSALSDLTPEQMALVPAMPPPPNVVSNFDNPDSLAPEGIAIISIVLALMSIFVGMRLYTRIWIVKNTGLDDWAILLASIATLGSAAVPLHVFSHNWLGPHTWDVRLIDFTSVVFAQLLFSMTILSIISNLLTKVSLFLFIHRIFPRQHASPRSTYATWIGLGFTPLAYIPMLIYWGVTCSPNPSIYGPFDAKCTPAIQRIQGIVAASVNAVFDLYILGIVVASLWVLRLPTKKKLGAIGVFAVGLVACGISFATLYLRQEPVLDPGRDEVVPVVFTVIEPMIEIITACIPVLPIFWLELSTKVQSSIRSLLRRGSSRGDVSNSNSKREYDGGGYELENQSMDRLQPRYPGGYVA